MNQIRIRKVSTICSVLFLLQLLIRSNSCSFWVFPGDDAESVARSTALKREVIDPEPSAKGEVIDLDPSTKPGVIDSKLCNFDGSKIVPKNYNINLPPPTVNGTPTTVQVAILIVNIRDIKDLSEELTLEMNLKMGWKDSRLKHLGELAKSQNQSFIVLHPDTLHKLWHPDIYIDHVKTITQPSIVSKPASLRAYVDGTLRYSARLTFAQACQMDFLYYPADTQHCRVDLMSYAYSDDKLMLTWKNPRGASLVHKLKLPNVDVGMDDPETFEIATGSGKYAGLRFTILLRRKLAYHLLQTYLPSSLFVFISWLSFLVPLDSVPGRMALCMTTLLTLTSMFASVRQNIPVVSYIKAIDVWMVSMIVFVFLSLLEFTCILKLKAAAAREAAKRKEGKVDDIPMKEITSNPTTTTPVAQNFESSSSHLSSFVDTTQDEGGLNASLSPPLLNSDTPNTKPSVVPALSVEVKGHWEQRLAKYPPDWIEHWTSIALPCLFFAFQLAYWPLLLFLAKYYDKFTNTVYYSAA